MTIPAKALRDFAFPAVAAGQRHLAAAARLSAKRSFRRLPRLFLPLDGTRYAHNGRKLSPAPTKAIRGDGYQRRQQIYSYEFDHQFTDVWSVYSAGSYTHTNVSLDQVYQGRLDR
ncbi:hypothetical protein LNP05_20955 [Klebsiella pneumoniae subsp. pneumoniae]|nr:hypothetical protein [Klebsiella pneumoniae subsp. pneumoniae]